MSVVVVTGATSGVGRAVAEAFARRGDRVGLLARGEDGLDGAGRAVEARGGTAHAVPTDVADADAVERAAGEVEERLGPIDVWVNNAMTTVFAPFDEIAPDEFRRVTEVTYLGFVHGTMAALRRMKPRDRGTVVQVGSALAYRGVPLQSAYCGAKHAVQGFTESVRCELLHDGSKVRLTMVQLPALNTPQFDTVLARMPKRAQPIAPIYRPEVAARAVVAASERPRREVLVGGSTIGTLLANAVAPGLFDRYLARSAVDGQQTDEPAVDHPVNLWDPVPGDQGAHGRFGDDSHARGVAIPSAVARGLLAAVGGAAAALCRRR